MRVKLAGAILTAGSRLAAADSTFKVSLFCVKMTFYCHIWHLGVFSDIP